MFKQVDNLLVRQDQLILSPNIFFSAIFPYLRQNFNAWKRNHLH
jgi:hypothetical protein